jgi:hypothetical protein
MADADDKKPVQPMNIYTAMLVLSFLAVSIGCLILAIELYGRGLPLKPGSGGSRPPTAASSPTAPASPAEPESAAEEVE